MKCFVIDKDFDDFDIILGMDVNFMYDILKVNSGVIVEKNSWKSAQKYIRHFITEIKDDDFYVRYSGGKWTVKWKWKDGNTGSQECHFPRQIVAKKDSEGLKKKFGVEQMKKISPN